MLHIDIETKSSEPIANGVYKYSESPDFSILCLAWDYEDEKGIIDFKAGEKLPEWLRSAILNPNITKVAFNATFERICLSRHILESGFIHPKGWMCKMIASAHDGIIGSLKVCAEHYGAIEKLSTGKELIKLFCLPRKKDEKVFNEPSDFPSEWEEFKHYCQVDVEAEKSIITNNGFDEELYIQSELINDRGIKVNRAMCENAVVTCQEFKLNAMDKLKKITGLANPNSHVQMKQWLAANGHPMTSTDRKHCEELMKELPTTSKVYEALETKISMSATSVSKYQKMLDMMCLDGRVRGIHFMNGGATRRFSGKGVQGQNMAKGNIDSTKRQELIEGGALTPDECKALVRSAIEGDFLIVDFTSIEKLVMSWLVDDFESLEAFDKGMDLYIRAASKIYNKPYESISKDSIERKTGKVAELAFGYQGARGAAVAFGADRFMTLDEIDELVVKWRAANPKLVEYWYSLQAAFMDVITKKAPIQHGKLYIYYRDKGVYIRLPNNLELSYPNAGITQGKYGFSPCYTRIRKRVLTREETYGGKIFENVVQSIAFMLLRETILRLKDWNIVMHIHDEVVVEKKYPWQTLSMLISIMTKSIPWCPGLKLKADGFVSNYYEKRD
jgi:DNA polymerase